MTRSDIRSIQSFFTNKIPSIWDEEDWSIFQSARGLEVFETDNDIVVKASVPGLLPNEVEVTFEDGVLRIAGRHEENEEDKEKKKVIYQSHRVSTFNYQTALPRMIDPNKITADIEHGVITVNAPLSEAAKLKKIDVTSKGK